MGVELGPDEAFPLSEKIIAATQSSHNAIENFPSVHLFPRSLFAASHVNIVTADGGRCSSPSIRF
jgi:hypothetical protein